MNKMGNNYKWNKIDKMPSNNKPLLILDSKNKLHILYKEWEKRDSFEKWFKLCSEEDVKKWCYFEIDGMNYFDGVLKQNSRLQSELDKQIKDNRKLVKALKVYAESDYWFTYDDEENVFMYGGNGYDLAQEVLKEVGEQE